jgi:adenylate cyclase
MLVIATVFAAAGAVFERLDSGVLTRAGPLIGLVASLPLLLFEVFFPLKFMRGWPFAVSVLTKVFLYVGLLWLLFLGSAVVYGLFNDLSLNDLYAELWSTTTLVKIIASSSAVVVIIFFRQLDRLLGPGTLIRYLFGRYHRPRREARIFMFLDLKDATSIAERLDVHAYYALLNDFFHDIAEPVLATRAQIYQYVGDQVVLTWSMATGLHESNCVRVFFEIDAVIRRHEQHYRSRYGVMPEYKAGVHAGEVIRAEIGDLKRDLIYNGDVLNTTARIQAECNRLEARLLMSSALFERILLPPHVVAESLGEIPGPGCQVSLG